MLENVLGVNVSLLDYDDIVKQLFQHIQDEKKSFVVAINPEKIMKSRKDLELKALLNKATYPIPDGIGVVLASRIQGGSVQKRITGIDMMLKICQNAEKSGKRVFLYGGKPGIAQIASEKLLLQFPKLKIAGTLHGFEEDNAVVIQKINDSGADILFVALGSPKQERWIIEHMESLNPYVLQGVGGSYDVIAGLLKRAPIAFQKVGLEWLYRLGKEPWRARRQVFLIYFLFLTIMKRRST